MQFSWSLSIPDGSSSRADDAEAIHGNNKTLFERTASLLVGVFLFVVSSPPNPLSCTEGECVLFCCCLFLCVVFTQDRKNITHQHVLSQARDASEAQEGTLPLQELRPFPFRPAGRSFSEGWGKGVGERGGKQKHTNNIISKPKSPYVYLVSF